jgi:hypothetical protein
MSETTSSESSSVKPKLLPRSPVQILDSQPQQVTLAELVEALPRIEPASDPSLCRSCEQLTLESLQQFNKTRGTDPSGDTYVTDGPGLAITWPAVRQSYERCPMCRLLACNQIWRSGTSPFNRLKRFGDSPMQLKFWIYMGDKLRIKLPEQPDWQNDSGEIEIFAVHGEKPRFRIPSEVIHH